MIEASQHGSMQAGIMLMQEKSSNLRPKTLKKKQKTKQNRRKMKMRCSVVNAGENRHITNAARKIDSANTWQLQH